MTLRKLLERKEIRSSMSAKPGFIKCYDTITRSYVMVEVSKEIEEFIKRSYWREDIQNRRYLSRKVNIEDSVEYVLERKDICDEVILNLEVETLKRCVEKLTEREKAIVYYVYDMRLNYSEAARHLSISPSYMSRLVKKLHNTLRESYELVW